MPIATGSKVVLVDDKWNKEALFLYRDLPIKGPVYVVRDVFEATSLDAMAMDYRREKIVCILLVGLHNPDANKPGARERGFAASRFRTLEEIKSTNQQTKKDEDDNYIHVEKRLYAPA